MALSYSEAIAPAKGTAEKDKITLLPSQSPAETFATLVHEVAHSDMHFGDRRAAPTNASARPKQSPWLSWFVARLG